MIHDEEYLESYAILCEPGGDLVKYVTRSRTGAFEERIDHTLEELFSPRRLSFTLITGFSSL